MELLEGEPSSVALKLNRASLSLFEKIQFRDYIRKARSSEEYIDSLEDFIDWHNGVSQHISLHLELFRDEVEKFAQIAQVSAAAMLPFMSLTMQRQRLEEGSPVQWAVTRSLRRALSETDIAPQPQLRMIYYPLRDMLGQEAQFLLGTLKKLAVLEIRYKRLYSHRDEINWIRLFDTSTKFFDLVTTTRPEDLAQLLTEDDLAAFRLLDAQSVISHGPRFQELHTRWDRLCMEAQEIVEFKSGFCSPLTHLAQVSL